MVSCRTVITSPHSSELPRSWGRILSKRDWEKSGKYSSIASFSPLSFSYHSFDKMMLLRLFVEKDVCLCLQFFYLFFIYFFFFFYFYFFTRYFVVQCFFDCFFSSFKIIHSSLNDCVFITVISCAGFVSCRCCCWWDWPSWKGRCDCKRKQQQSSYHVAIICISYSHLVTVSLCSF